MFIPYISDFAYSKRKQIKISLSFKGCPFFNNVLNLHDHELNTVIINTFLLIGNFAWNVWKGSSTEQLISTGMWSLCTGFSAAVLQIPRVRLSDLTNQLQLHRKAREKVKEVTRCWMDSDKFSYAKLVRPPVKQENGEPGFLMGKAQSIDSNCR